MELSPSWEVLCRLARQDFRPVIPPSEHVMIARTSKGLHEPEEYSPLLQTPFRYQNGSHDVSYCSFFEFSARRHPSILIYHRVKSSDTTEISVRLRGIISKNNVRYFLVLKFNPPKVIVCLHGSTQNYQCDTVVSMQNLRCRLPHNT